MTRVRKALLISAVVAAMTLTALGIRSATASPPESEATCRLACNADYTVCTGKCVGSDKDNCFAACNQANKDCQKKC